MLMSGDGLEVAKRGEFHLVLLKPRRRALCGVMLADEVHAPDAPPHVWPPCPGSACRLRRCHVAGIGRWGRSTGRYCTDASAGSCACSGCASSRPSACPSTGSCSGSGQHRHNATL
jgi:hypothetical protein